MRRVLFWRPADDAVVGEMTLVDGRASATGGAADLLASARGRGVPDGTTFRRYSDWSNGVLCSREVDA